MRVYEALEAVLPTTKDAERRSLHRLLTALSYTRLEIARNHAAEACGFAVNKDGRLRVNPSVERWLAALDTHADFPEMEHINEAGLLPGDYLAQWRGRLLPGTGVRNLLLGVKPEIVSKPDEEYKDPGVLTDGVRGLPLGYHYGWHISSGDLEVAFPAGYGADARRFEMSILELPRHRHSMGLNDPYAMEYGDTFPAGTDMTIRIMPPGAANLPVRFLVVPDNKLQPIREAVQAERTAKEKRAAAAAEAAKRKAAFIDTTIHPVAELQSDNQGEFTSLKDRLAKLQQKDKK